MKRINVMLVVAIFLLWCEIGYATFVIESESVTVDLDTRQASFAVTFNEPPDFYTVDEFGRIADSFQYYIDFEAVLPFPTAMYGDPSFETVIRGPEIYAYNQIPIRNKLGGSSDPTSGGWGEIRDLIPYILTGNTLTFNSSLESIGDIDGFFSYRLVLVEFGATTDFVEARSVPEPSTFALFTLSLFLARRK